MDNVSREAELLLSTVLNAILVSDMVRLVRSYLTGPMLLVIGGSKTHMSDVASGTAEVWTGVRWQLIDAPSCKVQSAPGMEPDSDDDGHLGNWSWQRCPSRPFSAMRVLIGQDRARWLARQNYRVQDNGELLVEMELLGSYSLGSWAVGHKFIRLLGLAEVGDGSKVCALASDFWIASADASHLVAYDYEQRQWRTLGRCPRQYMSLTSSIAVGNDIYTFMTDRTCGFYQDCTTWHALPPSRVARSFTQPVYNARRQCVYLVGGSKSSDEDGDSRSCECLATTAPRVWTEMPRMNRSRWGAALVIFCDQLIAIGGRMVDMVHVDSIRSDVERLDLHSSLNEWIMMPSMEVAREDALVLACDTFS